MKKFALIVFILLIFQGCLLAPNDSDGLVPQTVDENGNLPSIPIQVAGHERLVHFQTFGDSTNPALFIMHGSLSDMRVYLPLQELQDSYFVVFWDQRGNGLSERVPENELSYDAMIEEIQAVKNRFSPNRPIAILGHSWSAVFVAMYLGNHPESVTQAILMEPFGLSSDIMNKVDVPMNLMSAEYMDMMYSGKYLTPKDHETLDFQMLATLRAGVRNYFCDLENLPPWPVWRVGGLALITWEKNLLVDYKFDFDFTRGLSDFSGDVLLVGSECSPIGYEFQETWHQPLFQHAEVLRIHNSGHRMLTEQYDTLVTGLREFLGEYE